MFPWASAAPCCSSRHQAGSITAPVPAVTDGKGAAVRNATLKNAAGFVAVPAPPGWVAVAVGPGRRYLPVAEFHSPTPIAIRTVLWPGFQSWSGTSTSIWRRYMSTLTVGAGPATGASVPAWARLATSDDPDGCTVRNRLAGATALAPSGNGNTCPGWPPSAIENAMSAGFSSVFSVIRNAV